MSMNDFTKEELEHLSASVNCALITGYFPFGETASDLIKKTQSLIENYCEHEWAVYAVGNPMAYERPGEVKCSKCGARPNVNQ